MSTNENQKKNILKSLRVKPATKEKMDNFIQKINSTDECGRISIDQIVNFFLDNVSKKNIEMLQFQSITWSHEDKRLKRLWEKKKGKVSENKWKEMLYLGELSKFTLEHSRLNIVTN